MTHTHMKQVIKKNHVQLGERDLDAGGMTPASASATRARAAAHAPGVHLVRIDGRVQAIEVTCRCGDVSVLAIDYEETTPATEATS